MKKGVLNEGNGNRKGENNLDIEIDKNKFVMRLTWLIIGFLICILIVVIDMTYDPSRWLNLIRWLSGLKDESIAMLSPEIVIGKILQY